MSTVVPSLSVSQLPDADMQAVPAALARAALRAREVAARTRTPLIVTENGKIVEKWIQVDDDALRMAHIIKKHVK